MTSGAGTSAVRPHCLRCGSERVVPGNSKGWFTPHERRAFASSWFLNQTPDIHIGGDVIGGGQACVCLDCGLFWSSVNVSAAHHTIQTWGTKELKDRMAPETSSGRADAFGDDERPWP